ncbi:MAG: hypothetical protein BIFFINMI_01766 [Phycisphaerae bacterium]|nr:hypothetical protein [Phycisphaerae bacterium]
MSTHGDSPGYWNRRAAQFCMDPLSLLIPGWGALMMRVGPGRNSPPLVTPGRLERGLVLVLPGIEGPSFYADAVRRGLDAAGVGAALEICNWAGAWPGTLFALTRRGSDRQAHAVADRITDYRRRHAAPPVVLVGHSGGAAMVVFVAELLGPKAPLAGAIALAPALSPGYDLSRALAGVAGELVVCHSRRDVQLRMLTSVGGNFDRRFGRTAGQEGFAHRGGGGRLVQIAWTRAMASQGHNGGHIAWTRPNWVRDNLGPRVKQWIGGNKPAAGASREQAD